MRGAIGSVFGLYAWPTACGPKGVRSMRHGHKSQSTVVAIPEATARRPYRSIGSADALEP